METVDIPVLETLPEVVEEITESTEVVEQIIETEPELVQYVIEQTVDLTNIESLLTANLEVMQGIYVALLFVIGVTGACLVCYVLYSFIKKFF